MLLKKNGSCTFSKTKLELKLDTYQKVFPAKFLSNLIIDFGSSTKRIVLGVVLTLLIHSVSAQNQWTWMSGYLVSDAVWSPPRPSPTPLSIRGSPWVLDSTYKPAVREHCGGGIANNNEIYVYGGASLEDGHASDFWVYDISQQKWAFIEDQGWQTVYDQIGKDSNSAHPGGRNRMATAVDKNGNIWFFGGLYLDRNSSSSTEYSLSDLWKYNPKTRHWTYYGTDDASGNKPRARYRARGWFDSNNNFWMYAGADDISGGTVSYNDMWMYNTQTNAWAFISGNKNSTYDKNTKNGVYPATPGTGGTQYYPRARSDYGYWKDSTGNFWIYAGYVESHGFDEYGDLWKFAPTTKVWTLISGTDVFSPTKTATNPGSRNAPYCWVGTDNKLYFMAGGRKYDNFLHDCWRINTSSGSWEKVKDDSLVNTPPICGGYRIENATNLPGTQVCNLSHITSATHTYMFNGYGMGSNTHPSTQNPFAGYTAALWRYSLTSYNAALIPIAKNDTLVTPFKNKIYLNINANDDTKGSTVNFKTIDLNINMAGRQDSIVTANGVFSVDTLGILLFKPIANFQGTAVVSYSFQTLKGYVSNNGIVKITVYKCSTNSITLDSPNNDITQGNYLFQSDGTINATDKIVPQQNLVIRTSIISAKAIVFLPGFVAKVNQTSNFEAKIAGCN